MLFVGNIYWQKMEEVLQIMSNKIMKIILIFRFNISDSLSSAWTPRVICTQCHSCISNSVKKMKNVKRFFSPMLWREPVHHQTDCYFCLCKTTDIMGYNAKSKKVVEYPNIKSVTFPVPITQNEVNLNNHRESDNSEDSESEIQLSRHDEAQEGPRSVERRNSQDIDEIESKVSDEDVLQKKYF